MTEQTWWTAGVLLAVIGAIMIAAGALEWLQRYSVLRRSVFRSLDYAYENGYFEAGEYLAGASAAVIADDMRAFDEEAYHHTAAALLPHVQAWLHQKGLTQ